MKRLWKPVKLATDAGGGRSQPYRPVLKPYGGVGARWWQRNSTMLVGVVTCLLAIPYGFYYAITTPWLLVPFLVPLVILLMIVIWAVPEIDAIPERTMEWLTYACFVTLGLWPSYLAIDLPGLPWITIMRIVATPLTLLMLITVSMSPTFRRRFGEVLEAAPAMWRMAAIGVILQLVSIAFAFRHGDAFSKFVIHQTNETALFFMCCYVFRRPGRTERWAFVFWAMTVVTCVVGLLEFRQERVMWAGHVPSFIAIDETVGKILSGGMRLTTISYRAQSIFSTSLGFSEFLSFATPVVLHFAASTRYNGWLRAGAWGSFYLILLAIIASDSRLGILGFFLGSMLYLFFWAVRLWIQRRTSLIAPAVLLAYPVLFALLVAASFTVGRIKAKVWGMGQYDNSNQARIDQFNMGMPKLLTHPLGYGPGQSGEALGYMNLGGTLTIDLGLLSTALQYGILGFIVYYGLFVGAIIYALRHVLVVSSDNHEFTFALPLCISLVNFMIIRSIFAQEENLPIPFMIAGILVGLVYQARRAEGRLPSNVPTRPRSGALALARTRPHAAHSLKAQHDLGHHPRT